MKIYYNFVKHEFELNDPCISADKDLEEKIDCVEMDGDTMIMYVIYYEEQKRILFGHKTRHDKTIFNYQLQEYTFEGYVPVLINKNYDRFGYNIHNTKYEGENGIYFMISTWTKL
jgi:hypothetical protein